MNLCIIKTNRFTQRKRLFSFSPPTLQLLLYWYRKQQVIIVPNKQCGWKCGYHDGMFTVEEKHFADIWMTVWSLLCFVSTAFTALTFFIDRSRFRYESRFMIWPGSGYLFPLFFRNTDLINFCSRIMNLSRRYWNICVRFGYKAGLRILFP